MSVSPGEQDRTFPDDRPLSQQPRWRQDFPTDIPADDALSRREFTKFLVLTSGAFVAGQCWIGLMSLLRDEEPLPERRIAAETDVPPGAVIPEPAQGRLRCPCHNGHFEINEGRPIAGPPRRPLPRIRLEVRDGVIY